MDRLLQTLFPHVFRFLFVGLALASQPAGATQFYQCTGSNGEKVYTNKPCRPQHGPSMETVEREMYRLDRLDRKIAAVKRQIRDQEIELKAALAEIRSREDVSDEQMMHKARTVRGTYKQRIKDLSRQLTLLGESRNELVRHQAAIFVDSR